MNALQLYDHGPFPSSIMSGMQAASGANLESIQQLDAYIKHFFTFEMPKAFFIQMAVAGAWIAGLIILCSTTILYRMYKGAFWIFKLQRRPEGTYIVPNALNSFLLFEGVFAIVWIAFIIVQYYGYWRENLAMQHHIATFNLIIWWPLWIGAFMAGWGSFYTAPGALDKGPLSSTRLGKFAPKPIFINIFCLGAPVILIVSLIAPIVLSQARLNSALNAYQLLRADMLEDIAASASQLLSPSDSQMFLQRASGVWQMQTEVARYLGIGYSIWAAWAGVFLISYIPAAGYLVYLVYEQMRSQGKLIEDEKKKMGEIENQFEEKEIEGYQAEPPENSLLFQPLTSSQERQYIDGLTDLPTAPPTRKNIRQKELEKQQEEEAEYAYAKTNDVFFPPLKQNTTKLATVKLGRSKGSPSLNRYHHLRRCFINLGVLYVSIVLAAALYLGVSASLGRSLHRSYLTRPQDCSNLIYIICAIAAWGAVLFGTLTFFAIIARFADPANISSPIAVGHKYKKPSAPSDDSTGKKKSNKSTTQEHNRSLPAVPESVLGASREDPLTTFTGIDWDNFAKKSSKSRGKEAQTFKIKEKAGRGLILQPDDQSFNGIGSMTSGMDTSEGLSPRLDRAEGSRTAAAASAASAWSGSGKDMPNDVVNDDNDKETLAIDGYYDMPHKAPPIPAKCILAPPPMAVLAPAMEEHVTPPDTDRLSQISWKSFDKESGDGHKDQREIHQTPPRLALVSKRTSSLYPDLPDLITSATYTADSHLETPSTASTFPRTPRSPTRALPDDTTKGSRFTIHSSVPLSALMLDSIPQEKQEDSSTQHPHLGASLYPSQSPPMIRSHSAPRQSPGTFF